MMAKIVKYTTFKGTESEDPTEWFEYFERAANFKKKLIEEFTSEARKNKFTQELFSIKQRPNETIDQFAGRFRRTYKMSGQTLDVNMKNLLMLQALHPNYSYLIRLQILLILKLLSNLQNNWKLGIS